MGENGVTPAVRGIRGVKEEDVMFQDVVSYLLEIAEGDDASEGLYLVRWRQP